MINQQLPQMKSIWIDEDQEAEKLYSLQAQQLMGGDEFNITMVNSDKPALNNKKQIDLRPLTKKSNSPKLYSKKKQPKPQPIPQQKIKSKKSILNLFRSNVGPEKKQYERNTSRIISGPYDFHHISHAGGRDDVEEEEEEEPGKQEEEQMPDQDNSRKDSLSLNKAFVTETLRPESTGSSLYANSMKSESQHERIMSMSTTATTFLERTPSFNKIKRLSNNKLLSSSAQRNNLSTTERPDSMGSNLSINFLKNYSFPTLLEDEQVKDFHELEQDSTVTDLSLKHTKNQSITSSFSVSSSTYSSIKPTGTTVKPQSTHTRNSSAPGSLTTPELEQFLFSDSAFKDRISVDDILRYYHTTGDGELISNNQTDQNIMDSNKNMPQTQYL